MAYNSKMMLPNSLQRKTAWLIQPSQALAKDSAAFRDQPRLGGEEKAAASASHCQTGAASPWVRDPAASQCRYSSLPVVQGSAPSQLPILFPVGNLDKNHSCGIASPLKSCSWLPLPSLNPSRGAAPTIPQMPCPTAPRCCHSCSWHRAIAPKHSLHTLSPRISFSAFNLK